MRKISSRLITHRSVLAFVLTVFVAVTLAVTLSSSSSTSGVNAAEKTAAFAPKLSQEYVDFLKKQAEERKAFFASQSQTKKELKAQQKKERDEMLAMHRATRKTFMEGKHPATERHEFFMNQRNEWAERKVRHGIEWKEMNRALRQKLREFQAKQKEERKTAPNGPN